MTEHSNLEAIGWEEKIARIRSLNQEVAEQDYPLVWVGGPGMTILELLELHEMNDELPEELQIEPGEFINVEGTERGMQMPEVGIHKLSGFDVVRDGLINEMEGIAGAELQDEVRRIYAAKRGMVVAYVGDNIKWVPKEELSREDMYDLVGVPGHDMGAPLDPCRGVALEDFPPLWES